MPRRTAVTAGLLGLPLYAILLLVGTLTPQPDQASDPQGWARFVSTDSYLVAHIATNVVGTVLVVLGTVALAALIRDRAPRTATTGMVLSVIGQLLFTGPGIMSTFATPAIGQAYLSGNEAVMELRFSDVMTAITMLAVLLTVAGGVVLGVAVARSGSFPRWTGVVWAAAAVTFYLLGAALGMATTGASLPTQPVGAALMAVSGAAMAWTAARPSATPSRTIAATSARS